jgi:tetratricopeptide (TPR) repeat protein
MFSCLFVCLTVFFAGCAYFNTFYNAKKYYNRAYKEVEKNLARKSGSAISSGSVGKADFQKSIDKSLKLLDFYPNCKYVDDALLLLGKSYFYQEEYLTALRRFQELIDHFPQSEFRFEAELGMAKSYVALKQFDAAETILSGVVGHNISEKHMAEAYFYMGRFYETKKEYQKAVESFTKALKSDEKTLRTDAQFAIGDNYDSLKVFDKAAIAFHQIQKLDPPLETRFEAQFREAVSLKNAGEYDEAIRILERLLGDEKNKDREPDMKLEVGDCLMRKGDIDGAVLTYRDVIKLKEKSDYSAEAYYALGNIYETRRKDYDRALENYMKVKKENSRFNRADSAEIKGRDIQRMQALNDVIDQAISGGKGRVVEVAASMDSTEQDSLDSFGNLIYLTADSLLADSLVYVERLKNDPTIRSLIERGELAGVDESRDTTDASAYNRKLIKMRILNWRDIKEFKLSDSDFEKVLKRSRLENRKKRLSSGIAENPELKSFKKEELDKNLFLLAELYLFRFSMPDSALNQYQNLVARFPESPYAMQSLYNIHYIFQNFLKDTAGIDSTARRIITEFPSSPYAKELRKEMGLRTTNAEDDTIQSLFGEAENLLFVDKNPQAAIAKYRHVYEVYPRSKFAPKAFFSEAWVYENALDSLRLAYVMYDSLLKKYSDTPYANKVRKKVEAVKEYERNADGKPEVKLKQPVFSDVTPAVPDSTGPSTSAFSARDSLSTSGSQDSTASAAATKAPPDSVRTRPQRNLVK